MNNNPIQFDNTWHNELPEFGTSLSPTPLENTRLLYHNVALGEALGLTPDHFTSPDNGVFLGENLLPGMTPLAQVYSGHQFGVWAGQLGDGRGLLLGEQRLPGGRKVDWHLKGAGLTPYSRHGDGRAVLRSSIREFLASEALHGLGMPTTRALALAVSDTPVRREKSEPGALLLRIADSHLRFGHFEHARQSREVGLVSKLADYAIRHHWPAFQHETDRYVRWFSDIIHRTAELIASWQATGFSHGVMNTDNMSILGLTLDYGPFGFMDDYQPGFICNHSDYQGRYAFVNQPAVGLWNLQRLAQSLAGIIPADTLGGLLDTYVPALREAYGTQMRAKLGFLTARADDNTFLAELLSLMEKEHSDFTLTFRGLCLTEQYGGTLALRDQFVDRAAFDRWFARYQRRLQDEQVSDIQRQRVMRGANPAIVLRNWLAQEAISAAEQGDIRVLARLHQALTQPYEEHDDDLCCRPPEWGKGLEISCSS